MNEGIDEETAQELVQLLPQLRRFARGLTGSIDDADDLVQSACERAIDRIDQWRAGTRLDSWMYRIIQNIHIDGVRKAQTAQKNFHVIESLSADYVDGHAVADSRLMLDKVRGLVGAMAVEYRSTLLLVCVEGMTYRQAAEVLDVPVGTIMSRLARARRLVSEGTKETPAQALLGEQGDN